MSSRSNHGHILPVIKPKIFFSVLKFWVSTKFSVFTLALRFFIDRWSTVVTWWSFEVGNDFSLAQQSFTTLVLILLYPCLAVPFPLVQSVTGRPGQIWPCALNHHVPRDPMWPNRWQKLVVDKKIWSTHIFRDAAEIKLKTSRILTSILLSDPVRDQTSIFKVY